MEVPVLPAATVMVIRDGDIGLEVALLRRRRDSGFVPDAHVFPGGAVDPADHDVADHVRGASDREWAAALGLVGSALPFAVAATRETFEESGILLGSSDADKRWLHEQRKLLAAGQVSLAEFCQEGGVQLHLDQLAYFGQWITPHGAPRRYDTRFFVAEVDRETPVSHDGREAVASEWARPAHLLDRFRRGEVELIIPTERSLVFLASFDHPDAVFDVLVHPSSPDPPPPLVDDHGGWRVPYGL